ncbi:MAG: AtpZ/AtpI family protein [Henriciella sp.]|nr:AtpZ/AtpI family protein [Henriciella sp.]
MSDQKSRREKSLKRQVEQDVERRLRSRKSSHRSPWHGLTVFGLIGWTIVVPVLAGISLGLFLDATTDNGPAWTVSLLFAGLTVGCVQAWRWMMREGGRGDER